MWSYYELWKLMCIGGYSWTKKGDQDFEQVSKIFWIFRQNINCEHMHNEVWFISQIQVPSKSKLAFMFWNVPSGLLLGVNAHSWRRVLIVDSLNRSTFSRIFLTFVYVVKGFSWPRKGSWNQNIKMVAVKYKFNIWYQLQTSLNKL